MSANVPASKRGKELTPGKESRHVEEQSDPNMHAHQKTIILNNNMGATEKHSRGQITDPEMGARVPADKGGRGETDTLTASHVNETVRTAKEDVGAAKKAIDVQCGKNMDNMTQANSGCGGCGDCPDCK